jgi:hypothetical protein
MGLVLLAVAFALGQHAQSGTDLRAGDTFRWTGAGPVHVSSTSGASCAHSVGGLTRSVQIPEYATDLGVGLGALRTGHRFYGQSGRDSRLRCDAWVTVTAGPLVAAYPVAGSGWLLGTCTLLVLTGMVLGRRKRSPRSLAPRPAWPPGPPPRLVVIPLTKTRNGPRLIIRHGPRQVGRMTPYHVHRAAALICLPIGCGLQAICAIVGPSLGWPTAVQRGVGLVGMAGAYWLTYRRLGALWLDWPWPPWEPTAGEASQATEQKAVEPPDVTPG